jgi:hypothetical protein
LVSDERAEGAMATDGGDNQRIITPQQQSVLIGLERQAIDLLAPALDVGANVGGDFDLAVRLKSPQDIGE